MCCAKRREIDAVKDNRVEEKNETGNWMPRQFHFPPWVVSRVSFRTCLVATNSKATTLLPLFYSFWVWPHEKKGVGNWEKCRKGIKHITIQMNLGWLQQVTPHILLQHKTAQVNIRRCGPPLTRSMIHNSPTINPPTHNQMAWRDGLTWVSTWRRVKDRRSVRE